MYKKVPRGSARIMREMLADKQDAYIHQCGLLAKRNFDPVF